MASTVFDSALFRDMFGTAEMRDVFSDEALVGRYLEVEAALARAQARVGVVPKDAAEAIDLASRSLNIDYDKLRHETEIVGYPILPLVHQLSAAAGEAGRAGRTHLQQALPVTFGYKAAVWLSSIDRHIERIEQARPRVLVGEFAGAAGTLASIGEGGLQMQKLFCEELGLNQPSITWHVARDGITEAVTLLGLITGTLGKIATDVMMMSATEFGELSEPFVPGRGASSTMPQKRNPISSELMLAAAKAVRQHVATMLDGMIHDFERATGPWHLEWVSLPESFLLTASSLANAKFMLAGLVVHDRRMRENLDLTHGLIVAEAVMMALAPKLGRQHAHEIVYEACRKAIEGGGQLADILAKMPEIVDALGGVDAIRHHCDPVNYLGLSGEMVDRVLRTAPSPG